MVINSIILIFLLFKSVQDVKKSKLEIGKLRKEIKTLTQEEKKRDAKIVIPEHKDTEMLEIAKKIDDRFNELSIELRKNSGELSENIHQIENKIRSKELNDTNMLNIAKGIDDKFHEISIELRKNSDEFLKSIYKIKEEIRSEQSKFAYMSENILMMMNQLKKIDFEMVVKSNSTDHVK